MGLAVVLSALLWAPAPVVQGAVYQVVLADLAPGHLRPSSAPVAVLGLNISQNGGEGLVAVELNFTDAGADGDFGPSDLAGLSQDSASGVALYSDNRSGEAPGAFDGSDLFLAPSALPSWTDAGGSHLVRLSYSRAPLPGDDLGSNSSFDLFVAVRTSGTASDGDDFTVALASGGLTVQGSGGPQALSFLPVVTKALTVDAVPPRAAAGPDVVTDEGADCAFWGGGSSDNVGIANYSWNFGDMAADSRAEGVFVVHAYREPGTFIVVLNVTDRAGNSDEDTAIVTVRNRNSPPAFTSSPPTSVLQGETYIYLCQAIDPDDDPLRYFLVRGPANLSVEPSTGLVTWVPGRFDVGTKEVVLAVTDNQSLPVEQAFYMIVYNVEDPPYFVSLPVLIAVQDQPYQYRAEAEDPDPTKDLTFYLVSGPKGMALTSTVEGALVTWVPAWDQVGTNRVVLSVFDRQFTVYQEFTVNVLNSNDAPLIRSVPPTTAQQGVLYTYPVNAFDPDGDDLQFFTNPAPANMTVGRESGIVSWIPGPDQVGRQFVRLEVRDGRGGAANQTFYITVTNVNDPPILLSHPPGIGRQGANYTYRVQAYDPDGDALAYSLLSGPRGMSINGSSGLLEWLPGQSAIGPNPIAVQVSDGHGGLAVQAFQVNVLDVNDPPVVVATGSYRAYQGQPFVTRIEARDPDGDDLTYSLYTHLPNMELDRRTGVLYWLPQRPQVGEYHLAVRITDLNASFTDAFLNVTVIETNEPPRLQGTGVLRARANERFRFQVLASDPDNDPLTFTTTSKLFRINSTTGSISFVPRARDAGTTEFLIEVTDPQGGRDSETGVLVISAPSGGPPADRMALYGLAGLGGLNPWLVLLVSVGMAGILFHEYFRLRREQGTEERAEREVEAERSRRAEEGKAEGGRTASERAGKGGRAEEGAGAGPPAAVRVGKMPLKATPATADDLKEKLDEDMDSLRELMIVARRQGVAVDEAEDLLNRAQAAVGSPGKGGPGPRAPAGVGPGEGSRDAEGVAPPLERRTGGKAPGSAGAGPGGERATEPAGPPEGKRAERRARVRRKFREDLKVGKGTSGGGKY